MREINTSLITDLIEKLCMDANYFLKKDIMDAVARSLAIEETEIAKNVLNSILENAKIAREEETPMCQDTGMAVVFIEIGMDAHLYGGDLEQAINDGIRRGYEKGFLRKSIVMDPVERVNTLDNTPAVIHYSISRGDKIKIILAPKGFGSENSGALKMLNPSAGIEGIKDFILDTVSKAGGNPCPPVIAGVGIGGTMEKCALLAKKALLRPIGSANPNPFWNSVEKELLEKINMLGIGPAGFGGKTTALCVNIETFPTHIAGLPVAINIGCHATRHAEGII
ncbi:MAG: fumarate hydratase [Treponema sp.]|nr:fumarate hydratase [Treponema sp.]